MSILTVGPNSTYPTIADALAVANPGDELSLESGYGNESAVIAVDNLSVSGDATSLGIDLQLGAGIGAVTLLGDAPINVSDNSSANTITGNAGANVVTVSDGADVAHGGGGTDRLVVNYSGATGSVIGSSVNISDGGTHSVTFDGFEDFTVRTGLGADTITLGDGDNYFNSGSGDDTLTSGNGENHIRSGRGNDTVTAGDGGNGIVGGAGNDTITSGAGADSVDGGYGDDTITAGDGNNDVFGGRGNDTITTGSGMDTIETGLGDDSVLAGAGNDHILVNAGIDSVNGEAGRDYLEVNYSLSTTNVVSNITSGTYALGYNGTITDSSTASVAFSLVEDFRVETGSGNDTVTTGDGKDTLIGNDGNDTLNGGKGADVIVGGLGDDVLTGGLGTNDSLNGGLGVDTYVYGAVAESMGASHDVILGFSTEWDRFDLNVAVSGVDAEISTGQLDAATFNTDLMASVTSSNLAANHAVMFTADSGSEAGNLYVVVDANGVAGYQASGDYVFAIDAGHHMADLSTDNFI